MNYSKHYNALINRAKNRHLDCYIELHHVIPRCMGGSDDTDNLVNLTPEEHYVAHQLLIRIYPKEYKLIYAAMMMCANRKGNKTYGWLRKRLSKLQKERQKGEKNSNFNTKWITNGCENLKIKIDEKIPDGFEYGRTLNKKEQICKRCGRNKVISDCKKNNVCSRWEMINTMINHFGFKKEMLGTEQLFDEFNRIVTVLMDDYTDGLSVQDMVDKYHLTSNERMRKILKALKIERRSISNSMKNYYSKEIPLKC